MIIECSYCESNVDGKILSTHSSFDSESDPSPFSVYLIECPVCKNSLFAGSYEHEDTLSRLWPAPDKYYYALPEIVRLSIEEARRSFKGRAYIACAVMCGRVLEAVCHEFKTKNKMLAGGLKELLEKGVIDKRIYEWGEALRKHRNIGAHASTDKISKQDAADLLNFADAICDYVFVLAGKFEAFMKRQTSPNK